ncbi:hypothetical protein CRENBAI_009005, partial [Crenichthys baileyi]
MASVANLQIPVFSGKFQSSSKSYITKCDAKRQMRCCKAPRHKTLKQWRSVLRSVESRLSIWPSDGHLDLVDAKRTREFQNNVPGVSFSLNPSGQLTAAEASRLLGQRTSKPGMDLADTYIIFVRQNQDILRDSINDEICIEKVFDYGSDIVCHGVELPGVTNKERLQTLHLSLSLTAGNPAPSLEEGGNTDR